MNAIRVDIGPELHPKSPDAPSTYAWTVAAHDLSGRSRQPLLDACRALQAIGLDPASTVGMYRQGYDDPDISCPLGVGASLTVLENRNTGPRFVKYVPFPVLGSIVDAPLAG